MSDSALGIEKAAVSDESKRNSESTNPDKGPGCHGFPKPSREPLLASHAVQLSGHGLKDIFDALRRDIYDVRGEH